MSCLPVLTPIARKRLRVRSSSTSLAPSRPFGVVCARRALVSAPSSNRCLECRPSIKGHAHRWSRPFVLCIGRSSGTNDDLAHKRVPELLPYERDLGIRFGTGSGPIWIDLCIMNKRMGRTRTRPFGLLRPLVSGGVSTESASAAFPRSRHIRSQASRNDHVKHKAPGPLVDPEMIISPRQFRP